MDRSELCRLLDEQGIPYELAEHPAVFTIEEMERLGLSGDGEVAKNLFLRDDKKRHYYLLALRKDKAVNLKQLRALLGTRPLGFASEADLSALLGLPKGSVTPFGILNDASKRVQVILDRDLMDFETIGVHPNRNTATLWLPPKDLQAILERHGNPVTVLNLQG